MNMLLEVNLIFHQSVIIHQSIMIVRKSSHMLVLRPNLSFPRIAQNRYSAQIFKYESVPGIL